MIGTGTLINTAAIAAGGIIGSSFGNAIKERYKETLNSACGVSVLFIGIAGTMQYMLKIAQNGLESTGTMLVVLSLVLGGFMGELINIENALEKFAEFLKQKSGNEKDSKFINAFLASTFTVCIGAMAVIGAINDGIYGDWSVLGAKSVLDFIIILVMSCSLGKGCVFSAVPVFAFEGVITVLARFLKSLMTQNALNNLSLVGSILICCVGINLLWGKKIKVANLLPALIFAVAAGYLNIGF